MIRKLIINIAIMLTVITISACGNPNSAGNEEYAPPIVEQQEFHFERAELPGDMEISISQYADGSSIYLCGLDSGNKAILYSVSGTAVDEYLLPKDIEYPQACCVYEDNFIVLAGDRPAISIDSLGNETLSRENKGEFFILTYDSNHVLRSTLPLPQKLFTEESCKSISFSGEYYYCLTDNHLYQLDSKARPVNSIEAKNGSFTAQASDKNGLYLAYIVRQGTGSSGDAIDTLVSPQNITFKNILPPSKLSLNAMGLSPEGNLVLLTDEGIMSMTKEGGDMTVLCDNLRNFDNWSYSCIYPFSGGYIMCRPGQESIDMLAYGEETQPKDELLLWTVYTDEVLLSIINSYNEIHPQFPVRIVNLQDMDEELLKVKITSGEGPDLYMSGTYGLLSDVNKEAVYENLMPYVSNDESLEELIIPSVLSSSMEGEKLYSIPVTFEMSVLACRQPDLVPEEMSFDDILLLDEVRDKRVSIFSTEQSRGYVWDYLSNLYLSRYLDEATLTCSFTTDEYYNILKLSSVVPVESNMKRDEIPYIYMLEHIIGVGRLLGIQMYAGDSWRFDTGKGVSYDIIDAFSISASSNNKAEAWEFIEYAMESDFGFSGNDAQRQFVMPASRSGMENIINYTQNPGIFNHMTQERTVLNDTCIEQFNRALNAEGIINNKYPGLLEIMTEEAEKFFSGQNTAEEVARITQSRAELYLAERR